MTRSEGHRWLQATALIVPQHPAIASGWLPQGCKDLINQSFVGVKVLQTTDRQVCARSSPPLIAQRPFATSTPPDPAPFIC